MHCLPSATIRLLSSSQVITSVVSVVKELVENALDANATSIEIKLENFGFDKIEVRDNGKGIKSDDTPVMGVKHYTSKINSHDDLETLETYGFRGEALASICSVAEVHIATKTLEDDFSKLYILDSSGHVVSQKPSHLGQGTTVSVHKLFKNLPVRKQYYSTIKKCKEEIRNIQELLMAYGIVTPNLRILFTNNKALVWQKSKTSDHKMAFMSVVGSAIMNCMVPIQYQSEDPKIFINGYLPKPYADNTTTSLSSSEKSFLFINRRPIYHKEILKMVRWYHNQSLNKGTPRCYPVFFMNIELPASCLDVNLTPDKTQIMLQNKEFVLHAVENVLRSVYPDSQILETHKDAMPEDTVTNNTDNSNTHLVGNKITRNDGELFSPCTVTNSIQEEKQSENSLEYQKLERDKIPYSDNGEVAYSVSESTDGFLLNNESSTLQGKASADFGLQFAVRNSNLMDVQSNNTLDSVHQVLEKDTWKTKTLTKVPDIGDDIWSKGSTFKDSLGDNLEPIKILNLSAETPFVKNTGEDSNIHNSKNENTKPLNVISEKSGFVTAYDLISEKAIKKPLSAVGYFIQAERSKLIDDNPVASVEEISSKGKDLWGKLSQDKKSKYEEKAANNLERYNLQIAMATGEHIQKPKDIEKRHKLSSGPSPSRKVKLKTPLCNQQILDKLFLSQEKKKNKPISSVQVAFKLSKLKQQISRLTDQQNSVKEEFCFINKLSFPGAWIVASGSEIALLNPYRAEEALIFKQLLKNHKISAEKLDSPIVITDSLLGGSQYLDALLSMQKDSPKPNGETYFSDPRLTANGFLIKIMPGKSPVENHIAIEGMASGLPFYGVSDLKEILSFILINKSNKLCDCRPIKVWNYLEGEAVRLSRQLPINLSKEDVHDIMHRLNNQCGSETKACLHGHLFFHHLADVPKTD
ncbi:PMS1 protein homolog 1 [Xenopus tropicalis]|uniref:PMS1 protein homolog 1 n=2 Tax=Xenopus tropicalis TaxID=8364 RepID=A0A8J0QEU2_XENTR|nr:PMS1 protein homolog 1 [Xenopus tropicalis]|eukprot:XP_012825830.1 PREDICTED: PMS1 protein homolog 1 isoform X1 [Xenopus tropicalis]